MLPIVWLSLTACKVVDAPESLEELAVYGFVHFDDEDPSALEAAVAELEPLLDKHADELEGGLRVDSLRASDLEAVGVSGASVSDVVGAMGRVAYTNRVSEVVEILTHRRKDDLFEDILAYEILQESDRRCFLDGECDRYDQTVKETAKVTLLGEATRTYDQGFRWIEPADGERVLLVRTVAPNPVSFNTNIANVFQAYSFAMVYEPGKGSSRMESFWADAELIGVDVPDSFAVDTAVTSMGEKAESIDSIIDG